MKNTQVKTQFDKRKNLSRVAIISLLALFIVVITTNKSLAVSFQSKSGTYLNTSADAFALGARQMEAIGRYIRAFG